MGKKQHLKLSEARILVYLSKIEPRFRFIKAVSNKLDMAISFPLNGTEISCFGHQTLIPNIFGKRKFDLMPAKNLINSNYFPSKCGYLPSPSFSWNAASTVFKKILLPRLVSKPSFLKLASTSL